MTKKKEDDDKEDDDIEDDDKKNDDIEDDDIEDDWIREWKVSTYSIAAVLGFKEQMIKPTGRIESIVQIMKTGRSVSLKGEIRSCCPTPTNLNTTENLMNIYLIPF